MTQVIRPAVGDLTIDILKSFRSDQSESAPISPCAHFELPSEQPSTGELARYQNPS